MEIALRRGCRRWRGNAPRDGAPPRRRRRNRPGRSPAAGAAGRARKARASSSAARSVGARERWRMMSSRSPCSPVAASVNFPGVPGGLKPHVERAPAGAVEVARDPVAALATAVRQVLPAHGLGALAERGGDGCRVHGAAPAGARCTNGAWRDSSGLGRTPRYRPGLVLRPAPEDERGVRSTAARPGRERARSAAQGARVRKVAETRVAVSRALVPRSMPCIQRWRASPASTSTERRGSSATSSPGSAPAA